MTFNAMTERYEEITVCGKPALFTSIRIGCNNSKRSIQRKPHLREQSVYIRSVLRNCSMPQPAFYTIF